LFGEYKKLNPTQRGLLRDWLGDNSQESLQFLDRKAFDNFLGKSLKELPDGTMGYDLGKLAQNWTKIQRTSPDEADMLVKALGTNAQEFSGRMRDALVFSRKMDVGGMVPDAPSQGVLDRARRVLPGAVGSTGAGYQGAKVTDLTIQAGQQILSQRGLTADQIMKALITPEGADFLRQASMSPRSLQTLEALESMGRATFADKTRAAVAASIVSSATVPRAEGDIFIPDDIAIPEGMESMDAEMADDIFIPDDLMMPEAAPEPQAAWDVAPEEEQQVMSVLQGMSTSDPSLNVDYLMNAYRQADPTKRQQFMSLYGAQR
jgi:hypothetical protein